MRNNFEKFTTKKASTSTDEQNLQRERMNKRHKTQRGVSSKRDWKETI